MKQIGKLPRGNTMIYFDNAATGGFKPSEVTDAAYNAMKYLNANAGRSGHRLSLLASRYVYETRKLLSDFFDAYGAERIVFTSNCTEALNVALFGLPLKGGNVVTTVTEHNSVLRPLFALEKRGDVSLTFVSPKTGSVTREDVEAKLNEKTRLVAVNAVSNVTGTPNDLEGIGDLLRKKKILFLVDGAQAAGHLPLSMKKLKIDVLCAAGHKGLSALPGVGVLAFSPRAAISPLLFGGTGVDTFNPSMPEDYPEKLEAGTLNLPAILSLSEGIRILRDTLPYVSNQLKKLTEYLIGKLSERPFVTLKSASNSSGIVAFSHAEIPSQELAQILSDRYDIAVRGGFHCAPLMHRYLNSEKLGLVRVSLSPMNTRKEINDFVSALDEITLAGNSAR